MSVVSQELREARIQLGISQIELCRLADVSLATVQNIESGRANPSLSTIEKLAHCLGLEFNLFYAAADWDALVDHGLPLSKKSSEYHFPTGESLLNHLNKAVREAVSNNNKKEGAERKKESLKALLLAIKNSFPTFYRKHLSKSKMYSSFIPQNPSGRIIKLERIARGILGEYL